MYKRSFGYEYSDNSSTTTEKAPGESYSSIDTLTDEHLLDVAREAFESQINIAQVYEFEPVRPEDNEYIYQAIGFDPEASMTENFASIITSEALSCMRSINLACTDSFEDHDKQSEEIYKETQELEKIIADAFGKDCVFSERTPYSVDANDRSNILSQGSRMISIDKRDIDGMYGVLRNRNLAAIPVSTAKDKNAELRLIKRTVAIARKSYLEDIGLSNDQIAHIDTFGALNISDNFRSSRWPAERIEHDIIDTRVAGSESIPGIDTCYTVVYLFLKQNKVSDSSIWGKQYNADNSTEEEFAMRRLLVARSMARSATNDLITIPF